MDHVAGKVLRITEKDGSKKVLQKAASFVSFLEFSSFHCAVHTFLSAMGGKLNLCIIHFSFSSEEHFSLDFKYCMYTAYILFHMERIVIAWRMVKYYELCISFFGHKSRESMEYY